MGFGPATVTCLHWKDGAETAKSIVTLEPHSGAKEMRCSAALAPVPESVE